MREEPVLTLGEAHWALCIRGLHIHGFNQPGIENTQREISESPTKQNLNFPSAGKYLHITYSVFTTIYKALTQD